MYLNKILNCICVIAFLTLICGGIMGAAAAVNSSSEDNRTATVTIYGGDVYNVPGRWTNARNVVINGHSVTFTYKGKLITVMGNVVVEF